MASRSTHLLRVCSRTIYSASRPAQTLLYASVALTLEFFLGLALALLVDSLAHGRALIRVGLLAPCCCRRWSRR